MMKSVQEIVRKYDGDPYRLMDILIQVQTESGFISQEAIQEIAKLLNISQVDVEQTVTFYHFFTRQPTGKYTVYLNNSVVSNMMGREQISTAFEKECGIKFGEVTPDGLIGLFYTSCIGMSDQEPAALINGRVFTNLTPFTVREIVHKMKEGKPVEEMVTSSFGEGQNRSDLIRSVVRNNIRRIGPILQDDYVTGTVLREQVAKRSPEEVIEVVKASNLRGRGGAGFPTGLKWEFCRKAEGVEKYVICNADEGEPGTFKDRVILTERAGLLIEGMAIAGYCIGAAQGIIYLRYEYRYLEKQVNAMLEQARTDHMLGKDAGGIKGFDFNIRIQFGAGAYVCGEESALIESVEGKRGEPRNRPPFPVENGYFHKPTVINNVETLCTVVRIIQHGSDWFKSLGTKESTGTKLLSISGDCKYPGVYEVEWGFTINDIINMAGAEIPQAVQVGGPSGALIAPFEFNRILCFSDLSTGGSVIIFGQSRQLLKEVVLNFTEFFIEESCGSCVPCRNFPILLKDKLIKILNGHGVAQDIDDMLEWGKVLKVNRCGLGQTAGNPILSSIRNFRHLYEEKIQKDKTFDTGFDLRAAVIESSEAVGRIPQL
jgi:[NiFe] hydrogenase diaphorase moiety large subunit